MHRRIMHRLAINSDWDEAGMKRSGAPAYNAQASYKHCLG